VEPALHEVAHAIERAIHPSASALSLWVVADHQLHPSRTHRVDDVVGVVSGVRDRSVAVITLEQLFSHRRVVLLTRLQRDVERSRRFGLADRMGWLQAPLAAQRRNKTRIAMSSSTVAWTNQTLRLPSLP
jgi:hypothetical protein